MSLAPITPEEIRAFRVGAELSQAALAEALGISTRAVEEWEGGRRQAPPILRLALAALNHGLEPWGVLQPVRGRIMRPA